MRPKTHCSDCQTTAVMWARVGTKPDGKPRWRLFDDEPHPLGVYTIEGKRASFDGPSFAPEPDRYLPHELTCTKARVRDRQSPVADDEAAP